MDQKRALAANTARNRQGNTPARSGTFRLVHVILGLVLMAAGALKLHQLAFEAQDEGAGTLVAMALAEAELLGGAWMVVGRDAARTHPWVVAAFAGMTIASLFRALAGKCSCGCFGSLAIHPGAALAFSVAALAVLFAWRPPTDREAPLIAQPRSLIGPVLLTLIITIGGWRQADVITLAGTAMRDGRPLGEATLTFTGESGKVAMRTDRDGRFRLPSVRPGRYAVAVSGVLEGTAPTRPPAAGPTGKTAARRRGRTAVMAAVDGGRTLSWIEISGCSEENMVVEFK